MIEEYKVVLYDELIKSVYEHRELMIKHWSNNETVFNSLNDAPIEFFISDYIAKYTRLHAHKED